MRVRIAAMAQKGVTPGGRARRSRQLVLWVGVLAGPLIVALAVDGVAVAQASTGWSALPMASSGLQPASKYFSVTEDDVSCPTSSTCFVAGNYNEGLGVEKSFPLVETWDDGSWTATVLPTAALRPLWRPSFNAALASISCSTLQLCVAVGSYGEFGGDIGGSLVGPWWRCTSMVGG